MQALNSCVKIPTVSTRTSTSAPPALERGVNFKLSDPTSQAKPPRTFIRISSLNQFPLRPYSPMSWIPIKSKTHHEKVMFDISQSPQFGAKKENMLALNSHDKICKVSTRTSISAPPVLASCVDIKPSELTPQAKACKAFTKPSTLNQLSLRPNSHMSGIPTRSKTSQGTVVSDTSQSLQFGENKEKTWISDVYTRIGSLSRAMQREKTIKTSSASRTSLLGTSRVKYTGTAWLPQNNQGRTYQDWRGVVLSESTTPYTMLSKVEHQQRLKDITRRRWSKVALFFPIKEDEIVEEPRKRGKKSHSKKRRMSIVHEKVKRIGPHLEIFEAFRKTPKRTRSQKRNVAAATAIQKVIRGWLLRARWDRLKTKAQNQGSTLVASVKDYRKMMGRIKRRCGILDQTTPLVIEQLEDWLDNKLLYETMFTKRSYWKDIDRNELPKFFRDCGRFPGVEELNTAVNMVLEDSVMKIKNIKKHQAVEMAFMLYPPMGMKFKTAASPKSTWVKPIVNGEDTYKYLMSGHPIFKTADLRIAARLVAASMRERKKKENPDYTSSSDSEDELKFFKL